MRFHTAAICAAALTGIATAQNVAPDPKLTFPYQFTQLNDFNLAGSAKIEDGTVALTKKNAGKQQGALWAQNQNDHDEWTLEIQVSASGTSREEGGGLGIWYVADPGQIDEAGVHGYKDTWDGLGLMLDNLGYRDDNAYSTSSRGALRGHLNDGTRRFSSYRDAPSTGAFSLCQVDYRNSKAPITIRLGYSNELKTLVTDINGFKCFETDKVYLPKGLYFGISAAAGATPDAMTVHKWSLYPKLLPDMKKHIPHHDEHETRAEAAAQQDALQAPPAGQQQQQTSAAQAPGVSAMQFAALERQVAQVGAKMDGIEKVLADVSGLKGQMGSLQTQIERLEHTLSEFMRSQAGTIQSSHSDQRELLSNELNRLSSQLNDVSRVVREHTSGVTGSLSQAIESSLKRGPSTWVLFVLVILGSGLGFVAYNVWSIRRSYHAKIL